MAAAGGVGALGGNALYGWIGHRLSRRSVFATGFSAAPLTLGALALLPGLPATLLVLALLGLALSLTNLLEYSIYFERIPDELRARVLGITGAIGWATAPLGRLLAGALLAWLGLAHSLAALALSFLPLPLLIVALPALRGLVEPAADEA